MIAAALDNSKVPLVIGVTGHRNIRERDLVVITAAVKKVLKDLKDSYPHTPFIILSPLAEGADRLVAREAMKPEIGAQLIVPLPLPRRLFENDFVTEKSKSEFANFLENPTTRVHEIGLVQGNTLESISTNGIHRDTQYAAGGAYIVANCHILIALWDGKESSAVGGTAQIVDFKLKGIPGYLTTEDATDDLLSLGPIIHITTSRDNGADPKLPVATITHLFPESFELDTTQQSADFYHTHVFEPLDSFNAEPMPQNCNEESCEALLPNELLSSIQPEKAREELKYIQRLFKRADMLSLRFRERTRHTFWALSALVAIAAMSLDSAGHLPPKVYLQQLQGFMIGVFPLLLAVAFLLFHRAKINRYQDRYQDYRAIAEGLRVQFFWTLLGLKKSVSTQYLSSQRLELFWIRQACHVSSLLNANSQVEFSPETAQFARKYWVENQLEYFSNRGNAAEARLKSLKLIVNGLFFYGLIVAILLCIAGLRQYFGFLPTSVMQALNWLVDHHVGVHPFLMLSIIFTAVIATLVHNYIDKFALHAHAKRYHRMSRLFGAAAKRIELLNNLQDSVSIKTAFLNLGREALAENGEWVLTHRERPVEVPHH